MYQALNERLLELAQATERELVIVSAYAKSSALDKVLERVAASVRLTCYVRWDIADLAAGASDLDLFDRINSRRLAELYMCPGLHAKYYRGDDRILLGSANMTANGLGWSSSPNLEILVSSAFETWMAEFEGELRKRARRVDQALVRRLQQLLDLMPPPPKPICLPEKQEEGIWLPALRDPDLLFIAYSGNWEDLPKRSALAAEADLSFLRVPPGLSREAFDAWVGLAVAQSAWLAKLRPFVVQPRRFGEMSVWLRNELDAEDPKHRWQTMVRWIVKFLPDEFEVKVSNYSEVIYPRIDAVDNAGEIAKAVNEDG